MIEVSVTVHLQDRTELQLLEAALYQIDDYRRGAAPVTPSTPIAPPVTRPTNEIVKFPISQRIEDDTRHAAIMAAGKALVDANVSPSVALMEDAVKSYGRKHGFAKARTLLDEYTPGKLGSVPEAKRAELLARLTA